MAKKKAVKKKAAKKKAAPKKKAAKKKAAPKKKAAKKKRLLSKLPLGVVHLKNVLDDDVSKRSRRYFGSYSALL